MKEADQHCCDVCHRQKPLLISVCVDSSVRRYCVQCRAQSEQRITSTKTIYHEYGDPHTIVYPMKDEG